MPTRDKPLVWLGGEIRTPPFSRAARLEAGFLLRRLQMGEALSMPHVRPMPAIGRRCLELRIRDEHRTWRVVLRVDKDALVVGEVFAKTTQATPKTVIANCRVRFSRYDEITKE